MTFLRYKYKVWKLNAYVKQGSAPTLGHLMRRSPMTPVAKDRTPIRRRAQREKLEEIEANGQMIKPVWQLPPWRRMNVDARQHLANYAPHRLQDHTPKKPKIDFPGLRVMLVTDDRANVGFPTHFK